MVILSNAIHCLERRIRGLLPILGIGCGLLMVTAGLVEARHSTVTECLGSVRVHIPAGSVSGFMLVEDLPDECQNGFYFLTAESYHVEWPVIVNGRLHHGILKIQTVILEPLDGPLDVLVNYRVIPQ